MSKSFDAYSRRYRARVAYSQLCGVATWLDDQQLKDRLLEVMDGLWNGMPEEDRETFRTPRPWEHK